MYLLLKNCQILYVCRITLYLLIKKEEDKVTLGSGLCIKFEGCEPIYDSLLATSDVGS